MCLNNRWSIRLSPPFFNDRALRIKTGSGWTGTSDQGLMKASLDIDYEFLTDTSLHSTAADIKVRTQ
jgi:hypothetical protein